MPPLLSQVLGLSSLGLCSGLCLRQLPALSRKIFLLFGNYNANKFQNSIFFWTSFAVSPPLRHRGMPSFLLQTANMSTNNYSHPAINLFFCALQQRNWQQIVRNSHNLTYLTTRVKHNRWQPFTDKITRDTSFKNPKEISWADVRTDCWYFWFL